MATPRLTVLIAALWSSVLIAGCSTTIEPVSSGGLMPHGYCLSWSPPLLTLFLVGNILVAISYYSIPAALWFFVRMRKDLAFNWMFRLFGAFIFWCGTTHVMKLWTIWHADYWAEGIVDLITGVLSATTALLLWPLIPKAIALPTAKQLDEAVQFNRLILESAKDAFVAIDSQSKITDWNGAAETMFDWSRTEAIGRNLIETIVPERYQEKHSLGMKHFLDTGEGPVINRRVEMSALSKDGREFPIELSVFPVRLDQSLKFCAFIHDISDRKAAERSIQAARDQAIEASRFKSQFLANMSHEIRTPMNGILGMTEILSRSTLDDTQKDYVSTISEAGKSLLAVINDILDFSKIEAGKLVLETVEFEPVRLVESIADLLTAQARQKKLSLLTFIDPAIPLMLQGDRTRLRQILLNFAANAIKFSHKGEVLMRASLEAEESHQVTVKFSVTDSGQGMTEEEVDSLFEPFVQLNSSITSRHSGTGLGLSICKRLVELFDGKIGVHSVKNHGSTFWFEVQLARCHSTSATPTLGANLKGMRILTVDDEKSASNILHDYLTSWGMRNSQAGTTQEGLALLRGARPDDPYAVAIIDLIMPDTNGLQLAKIIREDESLASIKLILVTGFDKPGTGEEAIAMGFDAYLTKPIKQSQLLDSISAVVETIKSADDLPKWPYEPDLEAREELILVVEDHPINQQVALLLLKTLGFDVHIAENGRKALDLIQQVPYGLIFMDCQMPQMDGFAATRAIRKIETRTGKHLPIIAMTAHAVEGSKEQCLAAGMDDYLSKPVTLVGIKSVVDQWLPIRQ